MSHPSPALKAALRALDEALVALKIALSEAAPDGRRGSGKPLDDRKRAARYLEIRRKREQIVTPPLNDGSWAILIDLYLNHGRRPISISSACIGSGHPPTTALRWIQLMIRSGLIERESDDEDGRRTFLRLTKKGQAAVLAHLRL